MKIIPCNYFTHGEPFYMLDSNAYIEFARFYYKGKCSSKERTDFIKALLLFTRERGGRFEYELAGNEAAFDYGLNDKNIDSWNQVFSAVDTLIMEVPTDEISGVRKPVEKPFLPDRNNSCDYKSIFDCNFPQIFIPEESLCNVFYISYLYRIKIQELYQDKTLHPIDRINTLFDYMTKTICIFGDIEFQVAKMLFVGQRDEQTAKKLLKVDKEITVALLNNTVSDIVMFRIAHEMATRLPVPVFYITGDKGLQRTFELNKTLISSNFNIASVSEDNSDIKHALKGAWQELYESKIYPVMKSKFIMSPFVVRDLDVIIKRVKEEIVKIEREIIK